MYFRNKAAAVGAAGLLAIGVTGAASAAVAAPAAVAAVHVTHTATPSGICDEVFLHSCVTAASPHVTAASPLVFLHSGQPSG
jgi:hypothetical protein